jgi:hypothetical protein
MGTRLSIHLSLFHIDIKTLTLCSPQHTYHTQPQAAHLQKETGIINIDPTRLSAKAAEAAISRRGTAANSARSPFFFFFSYVCST